MGRQERRPQTGKKGGGTGSVVPLRADIQHSGVRKGLQREAQRFQDGVCTPPSLLSIMLPSPSWSRLPTSVAKKPLGRCLPSDARPPGPGLSLALMVCWAAAKISSSLSKGRWEEAVK